MSISSDDFASISLDADVWQFVAPAGATYDVQANEGDVFLRLETPAGDFNPYGTNNGARVLQNADDTDFVIETKWLTSPEEKYQGHGFLVEQDADTWIRMDVYSDGNQLYAYGGITREGSTKTKFNIALGDGLYPFMQLTRDGDRFTFDVSTDGVSWETAGSFRASLAVSAVGLMSNSSDAAGGYVAEADYFQSDSDPIADEDGMAPPAPPPVVVSDDFSTGLLNPEVWTFVSPAGASSQPDVEGTEAFVELTTPSGDFNPFNTNNGARLMQEAPNEDFILETRWLSIPSQAFQGQGFLIESDAENWLRVDVYSDGTQLYAYGGETIAGVTSTRFNIALSEASPYMQLERVGDDFTFRLSTDGEFWTDIRTFNAVIEVGNVGLMSISTAGSLGYTARADYFQIASDPIVDEDGVVVPPPANTISDDFSAVELDANVWTFTSPEGATFEIGTAGEDSFLQLETPAGDFNPYITNNGVRVTQAAENEDFVLEARWLSSPEERYEGQGFLVEEAPDKWLRVDIYSDGNQLYAYGGFTRNGDTRTKFNVAIGTEPMPYMRLIREDNKFWFELSADGIEWTTIRSFRASLEVSSVGLMSNSSDSSNGYVAKADYFEIDSDPILDEDASVLPENTPPTAIDDAAATILDTPLLLDVLGNDSDADGDVLTVDSVSDPINGSATIDASGAILYTPDAGFTGSDVFTYNVSDGRDTSVASVTVTVTEEEVVESNISADDFSNGAIDPALWTFMAPTGATARIGVRDGDSFLRLDTPEGDFNPYNSNNGARLLQDSEDTDFAIQARWLSEPSQQYQSQGFLVEADANTWLRVDVYSDGSQLYAYGGFTQNGSTQTRFNVALGVDPMPYMQLTREGDRFTYSLSADGVAWNDVGSFNAPMVVSTVGLMSSSSGGALGFVAEADWFQTSASPIADEDGNITPPTGNNPPFAVDDAVTTMTDAPVVVSALQNDSDADGDTLSIQMVADPANGSVVINGDGTLTYTPDAGFSGIDSFDYTVSDGTDTDAATVTVTVSSEPVGNRPPTTVDDVTSTEADTPVVVDVLANDSDLDGDVLVVASTTNPSNGAVVINPNGTITYTPNAGFEGSDSFTYTVSDGEETSVATVSVSIGDPIDVWYGNMQTFGAPGEAQRWVNVLGNVVPTGLVSLTYTLNDGPLRELDLGPDTRRLAEPGDFNVDLDFDELDGSPVDDVITLTATYSDGSVYVEDVVIDFEDGQTWDADYSIDWSTVTDIQDVVQVVDGKWELTGDGLRLTEPGYDRFVLLGDDSWDYYDVRLTLTGHDLYSEDPRGRDGGVFGFGTWWEGHTDDPISGWQPKSGWDPSEWVFYYNDDPSGRFRFFNDGGNYTAKLEEGVEYEFAIRIEQANVIDKLVSLKFWEVGTPEPVDWLLQRVIDVNEPTTSAFALLSHYYDVEFHDVAVTEIKGSDIIRGSDDDELIAGVDPSAVDPGQDEIDVLIGGAGADVFILGDADGAYYDDGTSGSGLSDYGYIWDFVTSLDVIQLYGSAADYVLSQNLSGLPSGTAILLSDNAGGDDELIGVVADVAGLDLNSDHFVFADAIA